jgi:hypothetical protein
MLSIASLAVAESIAPLTIGERTPLVGLSGQPGLNGRWKWTRTEDVEHVDMQRTSTTYMPELL